MSERPDIVIIDGEPRRPCALPRYDPRGGLGCGFPCPPETDGWDCTLPADLSAEACIRKYICIYNTCLNLWCEAVGRGHPSWMIPIRKFFPLYYDDCVAFHIEKLWGLDPYARFYQAIMKHYGGHE